MLDIVLLNGSYDLVCGTANVLGYRNFITRMHAGVLFLDHGNNGSDDLAANRQKQRFMGYWILTYGLVRCCACCACCCACSCFLWQSVVACTYLVEAAAYVLEAFVFREAADPWSAAFVGFTSMVMGTVAVLIVSPGSSSAS